MYTWTLCTPAFQPTPPTCTLHSPYDALWGNHSIPTHINLTTLNVENDWNPYSRHPSWTRNISVYFKIRKYPSPQALWVPWVRHGTHPAFRWFANITVISPYISPGDEKAESSTMLDRFINWCTGTGNLATAGDMLSIYPEGSMCSHREHCPQWLLKLYLTLSRARPHIAQCSTSVTQSQPLLTVLKTTVTCTLWYVNQRLWNSGNFYTAIQFLLYNYRKGCSKSFV